MNACNMLMIECILFFVQLSRIIPLLVTFLFHFMQRKSSLGINLGILCSKRNRSTRICFHYFYNYFSCIRILMCLLYLFLLLTFYCNKCVTSTLSCMTNVIFPNTQVLCFVDICVQFFRERNSKIGHKKERQNNMHILQPKL